MVGCHFSITAITSCKKIAGRVAVTAENKIHMIVTGTKTGYALNKSLITLESNPFC